MGMLSSLNCFEEALLYHRLRNIGRVKGLSCKSSIILIAAMTSLSACNSTQVLNQGYVLDQESVDAIPVGSSREQVLLSLGTPSTTQNFDANEIFYYVTQKRKRNLAFQKLRVVDQSILAVYFDEDATVSNIANYTMQDGKVFDMISRTTPTSGKERGFLAGLLAGFADGTTNPG